MTGLTLGLCRDRLLSSTNIRGRIMTDNEKHVLRDALCEYIMNRGCDPHSGINDRENIENHVKRRYCYHAESLRALKRTLALTGVRVARDILMRKSDDFTSHKE